MTFDKIHGGTRASFMVEFWFLQCVLLAELEYDRKYRDKRLSEKNWPVGGGEEAEEFPDCDKLSGDC